MIADVPLRKYAKMPDSEPKGTTTELAIKWVFGQPFNNVMLIAIFAGIAWISHYCITIAIPSHLKMIQQGYETINTSNQLERHEMRAMYDKWFDRVASEPTNHAATPENPDTTAVNN